MKKKTFKGGFTMKRYKPSHKPSASRKSSRSQKKQDLTIVNPKSAGIDIGSRSHFVAVHHDSDNDFVKEFSSTTSGLLEIVSWLKECNVETVAMESTGSYWIPVYEVLESNDFDVCLVNAKFVKNVPGRKSDVEDCQWIQKLHSFGLLAKSFRPKDHCMKLRSLTRHHSTLIQHRSPHIQHMQKALLEMNIQLATHLRDITGVTGMKIINAIIAGERDPEIFAGLVHPLCKKSPEEIIKSLEGNYREEHLFCLKQARDLYVFYSEKVRECEAQIKVALDEQCKNISKDSALELMRFHEEKVKSNKEKNTRKRKSKMSFDPTLALKQITNVDLTEIPGIDQVSALKIISELGGSVDSWKTAKQFASWLGLCPGNKISGGKIMSGKTKPCVNRIAQILRMAANGLWNSKSYLGAYLRKMKSRLGGMKAVTAAAHKLARIIHTMIKYGKSYKELGEETFEKEHNERRLKSLIRRAKEMGLEVVPVKKGT